MPASPAEDRRFGPVIFDQQRRALANHDDHGRPHLTSGRLANGS
jgi:hypothetical protein